jgi:hypothetical protein
MTAAVIRVSDSSLSFDRSILFAIAATVTIAYENASA